MPINNVLLILINKIRVFAEKPWRTKYSKESDIKLKNKKEKGVFMYEQLSFGDQMKRPLAERMRPNSLKDFVGQDEVIGAKSFLRRAIETDTFSSLILWGPPGCGKTTLVHIISEKTNAMLYKISAVTSGVKEIKEVLDNASQNRFNMRKTILFIDEIHRLNKAQQDVLLPDVENGNIILIGATTENPSFEINKALLSRSYVVSLKPLSIEDIETILKKAILTDSFLKCYNIRYSEEAINRIAVYSGGDARNALNMLEFIIQYYPEKEISDIDISLAVIDKVFANQQLIYDKKGDEHYNIISALHKSMRNSDPDAAVYWLSRMLEAGEDPLLIARRLIRFASEDIGLADYKALNIATSAYEAAHYIGMPECTVNLTQAVVYLAIAPKSNALYLAYENAKKDAKETRGMQVPLHLRNASTELMESMDYGKGYQYAHDYEGYITNMNCLPDVLKNKKYYFPRESGGEKRVKERLKIIEKIKENGTF